MTMLLGDFFNIGEEKKQEIRLVRPITVAVIRAYFYAKKSSLVNITMRIYDGTDLLAESSDLSPGLLEIADDYFYGFMAWTKSIRLGGRRSGESYRTYNVGLEYNGNGSNKDFGWLIEYDRPTVGLYGIDQINNGKKPKTIEIYTYN